jgi:hypothetical protein
MVKKPKRPTKTANIKEQLEKIVGHKIDESEQQLARFSFPVGSFAYLTQTAAPIDSPILAFTTWKSHIPFLNKFCFGNALLEASGGSSTLADGKRVFLVSDFLCGPYGEAALGFAEPINVVATPRAESPLFLTVTYSLVSEGTDPQFHPDVQITVFARDANGVAAPNVEFDWRCRAHVFQSG